MFDKFKNRITSDTLNKYCHKAFSRRFHGTTETSAANGVLVRAKKKRRANNLTSILQSSGLGIRSKGEPSRAFVERVNFKCLDVMVHHPTNVPLGLFDHPTLRELLREVPGNNNIKGPSAHVMRTKSQMLACDIVIFYYYILKIILFLFSMITGPKWGFLTGDYPILVGW